MFKEQDLFPESSAPGLDSEKTPPDVVGVASGGGIRPDWLPADIPDPKRDPPPRANNILPPLGERVSAAQKAAEQAENDNTKRPSWLPADIEFKPEMIEQCSWRRVYFHKDIGYFKDAQSLWDACCDYFQWVVDHPVESNRYFTHEGSLNSGTVKTARAMSLRAMCVHMGISDETWYRYRRKNSPNYREDLVEAIRIAESVIFSQKFEYGMAGVFNANLVARDLGLTERSEIRATAATSEGPSIGFEVSDTWADKADLYHPDDKFCDDRSILYTKNQLDAGAPLIRKPDTVDGTVVKLSDVERDADGTVVNRPKERPSKRTLTEREARLLRTMT